jgi:hypothetical protein
VNVTEYKSFFINLLKTVKMIELNIFILGTTTFNKKVVFTLTFTVKTIFKIDIKVAVELVSLLNQVYAIVVVNHFLSGVCFLM